jgi:G3E family GTPase
VDALNFEKLKFNTRVINQIRAADEIIINKIDLATNKIENTLNEVKVINPFAEIKLTSFCDIDFEKLQNDIGASAYKQLKTQKSLSNNKPDVETKVFKNHMKFDMDIFGNLLSNIGDSLFRLKGYLWETDNRIFAVQYVFGKISFQRIKNYSGPNLIVALGNNGSLDPLFNSIRSIAK